MVNGKTLVGKMCESTNNRLFIQSLAWSVEYSLLWRRCLMSVKKVKISQLQQEGKEYLKKQRIQAESKPGEGTQDSIEDNTEQPIDGGHMNSMNHPTKEKKVPLLNKSRQMQNQLRASAQQAMKWSNLHSDPQEHNVQNYGKQPNYQSSISKPPTTNPTPSMDRQPNPLTYQPEVVHTPYVEIPEPEPINEQELHHLEQDILDLNDAGSVLFKIPIFFSHQNLSTLGPDDPPPLSLEQQFIIQMFKEIKRVLLFPRTLPKTNHYPNTRLENISTIIQSSYGTVAALLAQTETAYGEPYTPFSQFEPAMAYQKGHPLLLVIQDTMTKKAGGVWDGLGSVVPNRPIVWQSETTSVEEFFSSYQWNEALYNWATKVRNKYSAENGIMP